MSQEIRARPWDPRSIIDSRRSRHQATYAAWYRSSAPSRSPRNASSSFPYRQLTTSWPGSTFSARSARAPRYQMQQKTGSCSHVSVWASKGGTKEALRFVDVCRDRRVLVLLGPLAAQRTEARAPCCVETTPGRKKGTERVWVFGVCGREKTHSQSHITSFGSSSSASRSPLTTSTISSTLHTNPPISISPDQIS